MQQLIVLLGLFLVGASAFAADPARVPFSSSIPSVDAAGFPAIGARVLVFSRSPLPELSRDDFVVTEDGAPVADFSVLVEREPFYVSLVLDRSGSMTDAMGQMQRAAWDFLKLLEDRAFFQLITFASDVRKHSGFGNDPAALRRHVVAMAAFGATAFYDALGAAVDSVAACPDRARRIVVAFTDGVDQNSERTARLSRLTARELVKKARDAGVTLYLIGLGGEVDRHHLQQLATLTGGRFLFSPDAKELSAVFQRVARMVEVAYRIGYATPRPAFDGSQRTVRIGSRLSGHEDQGVATYVAPSTKVPPARAAAPAARADGRFAVDPLTFEKEDLDAGLLVPRLIEDAAARLSDDEPAKPALAALIAATNGELQGAYDRANRALGPLLLECARAIAREDFEALGPLVDRGRAILGGVEDEVLPLLKTYMSNVAVFQEQVEDRSFKLSFNLRVANTDMPRISLLGQCQDLRTGLLRSDMHNNTHRRLVEAFNAMVGRSAAVGVAPSAPSGR